MVEYFDVNIEKKKLSATANLVIPSGNVNTYALRLHISGKEWENLAPLVAFYSKEQKYIVMATDYTYVIPAPVLKTRGRFSFGVFATQLDNNGNLLYRFSTNLLQGLVIEGAYSTRDAYEDNPEEAALYEQLLFQTNAIHTNYKTQKRGNSMKINWKQKLTSRKFWAAVVTFVTTVLVAFGVPDLTIEQVTAIITAGASMIAYIIGEGLVDAARMKAQGTDADQLRESTKMMDGSKQA